MHSLQEDFGQSFLGEDLHASFPTALANPRSRKSGVHYKTVEQKHVPDRHNSRPYQLTFNVGLPLCRMKCYRSLSRFSQRFLRSRQPTLSMKQVHPLRSKFSLCAFHQLHVHRLPTLGEPARLSRLRAFIICFSKECPCCKQ